jgi:hypothetical protein
MRYDSKRKRRHLNKEVNIGRTSATIKHNLIKFNKNLKCFSTGIERRRRRPLLRALGRWRSGEGREEGVCQAALQGRRRKRGGRA